MCAKSDVAQKVGALSRGKMRDTRPNQFEKETFGGGERSQFELFEAPRLPDDRTGPGSVGTGRYRCKAWDKTTSRMKPSSSDSV